jgi:hypothetical protein
MISAQARLEVYRSYHTFEVEENVRLVIFEHLCHQLDIHVLDVNFLQNHMLDRDNEIV